MSQRSRHPAGLYVLFFTEMWERFGFYCMEAVFVFYMQVSQYEFLRNYSSRIYGLYLAGVYFTPFFGGLLAEWRFGYFLSIILGGFCMAGGYGLLSLEPAICFGLGLAGIIIGNGLFKPNISSLVGKLYPQGDKRVDAAFTIFYMGINIGALMAPIIAGMIGILMAQARPVELIAGHLALLGGDPGLPAAAAAVAIESARAVSRAGYLWVFGIAAAGMITGEIVFLLGRPFVKLVRSADTAISIDEVPAELVARRKLALIVFFAINVLFWMAFKQRANSINNWIEKRTDLAAPYWLVNTLSTLGIDRLFLRNGEMAKELFQALNPFFVILLSPILVMFWAALRRLRLDVPTPAKLVLGFAMTSGAFAIMWWIAAQTPIDVRAPSSVLVAFYACLTIGELCLSPMGLSLVSKLAPTQTRAIWMGLFFVSTSVGGYLAGEIRQLFVKWEFADFFLLLTCSSWFAGLLMVCAYPLITAALRPVPPPALVPPEP